MDLRSGPQFDVGLAFTFPFAAPGWGRALLSGAAVVALACVGVGLPVLLGGLGRLFREAVRDDVPRLPSWEPARDFRAGLLPTALLAAWLVPPLLLVRLGPTGRLGGEIWLVAAGVLFPAALTRVWVGLRAAEALDLLEIVAYIRDNGPHYVLLLLVWMAAAVLGALGLVAAVAGVFATVFWGAAAAVHALAQVYRLSRLHTTPALAPPGKAAPAAVA